MRLLLDTHALLWWWTNDKQLTATARNAMLDDSDVHWHRQIKSCVGGVTAAVTGDPAVFVSVSAAHQGPDGGGPVAAIVDLGAEPTGYRPPPP